MKKKHIIERMAENEAIFRKFNESTQQGLRQLAALAKETGDQPIIEDDALSLHFYCECSDEKYTERIVMKPSKYEEIHTNRKRFIVIPGHEVPEIETNRVEKKAYTVVEKFVKVPEPSGTLNSTPLDNS